MVSTFSRAVAQCTLQSEGHYMKVIEPLLRFHLDKLGIMVPKLWAHLREQVLHFCYSARAQLQTVG